MHTCQVCGDPIPDNGQLAFVAGFYGKWGTLHRTCMGRLAQRPEFERIGAKVISPRQARALRRSSAAGAVAVVLLWLAGTALAMVALVDRPGDTLLSWLAGISLGVGGPIAFILSWEVLRIHRSLA